MKSKEQGLTVGELTMIIGALIIGALIWTTISKKEESYNTSKALINNTFSSKIDNNAFNHNL